MHQKCFVNMRHQEGQRASVTNLLVVVAAGVTGLITFDGKLDQADTPLALFLTAIALSGSLFSLKLYERFQYERRRAHLYYRRLDALIPDAGLCDIYETNRKEHADTYTRLSGIRTHHMWLSLHVIIALLGVILTVMAVL
jgi:hypothetical protein